MAYERYNEQDDEQQPVRQWQPPQNQTQPMGLPEPLDFGQGGAIRPPGARPMADVQNDFMNDPRHAGLSQQQRQGAFNGLMSLGMGGGNQGPVRDPFNGTDTHDNMGNRKPTGGGPLVSQTGGGLSPMAGGAMARYGTGNIPGAENITWGDTSGLRGFNTNEWGEGGTEGYEDSSIKNTFGKIATRYPHNADGLRALVQDPDFVSRFPEARLREHPTDPKIDFGDGNPVDVLFQSDQGWQWGPENEMGGGGDAGGMGGMAGGMGMPDLQSILSGSDPLTDIIKRIGDLQGGGTPDAEQQALIQMIRGEENI
jgi:hypothetical protein